MKHKEQIENPKKTPEKELFSILEKAEVEFKKKQKEYLAADEKYEKSKKSDRDEQILEKAEKDYNDATNYLDEIKEKIKENPYSNHSSKAKEMLKNIKQRTHEDLTSEEREDFNYDLNNISTQSKEIIPEKNPSENNKPEIEKNEKNIEKKITLEENSKEITNKEQTRNPLSSDFEDELSKINKAIEEYDDSSVNKEKNTTLTNNLSPQELLEINNTIKEFEESPNDKGLSIEKLNEISNKSELKDLNQDRLVLSKQSKDLTSKINELKGKKGWKFWKDETVEFQGKKYNKEELGNLKQNIQKQRMTLILESQKLKGKEDLLKTSDRIFNISGSLNKNVLEKTLVQKNKLTKYIGEKAKEFYKENPKTAKTLIGAGGLGLLAYLGIGGVAVAGLKMGGMLGMSQIVKSKINSSKEKYEKENVFDLDKNKKLNEVLSMSYEKYKNNRKLDNIGTGSQGFLRVAMYGLVSEEIINPSKLAQDINEEVSNQGLKFIQNIKDFIDKNGISFAEATDINTDSIQSQITKSHPLEQPDIIENKLSTPENQPLEQPKILDVNNSENIENNKIVDNKIVDVKEELSNTRFGEKFNHIDLQDNQKIIELDGKSYIVPKDSGVDFINSKEFNNLKPVEFENKIYSVKEGDNFSQILSDKFKFESDSDFREAIKIINSETSNLEKIGLDMDDSGVLSDKGLDVGKDIDLSEIKNILDKNDIPVGWEDNIPTDNIESIQNEINDYPQTKGLTDDLHPPIEKNIHPITVPENLKAGIELNNLENNITTTTVKPKFLGMGINGIGAIKDVFDEIITKNEGKLPHFLNKISPKELNFQIDNLKTETFSGFKTGDNITIKNNGDLNISRMGEKVFQGEINEKGIIIPKDNIPREIIEKPKLSGILNTQPNFKEIIIDGEKYEIPEGKKIEDFSDTELKEFKIEKKPITMKELKEDGFSSPNKTPIEEGISIKERMEVPPIKKGAYPIDGLPDKGDEWINEVVTKKPEINNTPGINGSDIHDKIKPLNRIKAGEVLTVDGIKDFDYDKNDNSNRIKPINEVVANKDWPEKTKDINNSDDDVHNVIFNEHNISKNSQEPVSLGADSDLSDMNLTKEQEEFIEKGGEGIHKVTDEGSEKSLKDSPKSNNVVEELKRSNIYKNLKTPDYNVQAEKILNPQDFPGEFDIESNEFPTKFYNSTDSFKTTGHLKDINWEMISEFKNNLSVPGNVEIVNVNGEDIEVVTFSNIDSNGKNPNEFFQIQNYPNGDVKLSQGNLNGKNEIIEKLNFNINKGNSINEMLKYISRN